MPGSRHQMISMAKPNSAAAVQGAMLLRLTHRMAWTVDPLPVRRAGY
jgi:hypothetical protein